MDTQSPRLPTKRTALRAFIGSIVASAALGTWALLAGGFGSVQIQVLVSSLSVSAASLCALGGAAAIEARGERRFGVPAIVLSGVALALVLVGIWGEVDGEAFWKTMATAGFFAAAFAHVSLLGLARFHPGRRWLRAATQWLVLGLAIYGSGLLWSEADDAAAYRVLGVLSILVAAVTLATPVVHRLDGDVIDHDGGGASGPDAREVSMLCPVCSVNFRHALGAVRCPRCGARFMLRVLEGAPGAEPPVE